MKKNKKNFIGLLLICTILLIVIICIFAFRKENEKSIMYCYKEGSLYSGINQTMSYEVLKGNGFIKLKQQNTIELNDSVFNQLISKGYNLSTLEEIFKQMMDDSFSTDISEELESNITYEFYRENMTFYMNVEYFIDEKSKENFSEFFKIDFYSSKTDEMLNYFEGRKMKCEIK